MTGAAPVDAVIETERLRRLFRLFGATQARGKSAVYEGLSEGIAGDDEMLRFMLATPADQRRPSLLFAAVNLVLASDIGSELASYYPIHGGRRPPDDQLPEAFTAFCEAHREALLSLLRERSTQTNEIRRCIALRLGLHHVARHWPGPIALMEVGASAGLNLLFDHYRYRLNGLETTTGDTSPVVISCEIRGARPGVPLLGSTPAITSRLGLDQNPINLTDPDARAWLEAFVWPEQTEDLVTLRGATELARSTHEVKVERGEATADTARMIADLPGEEPVAVFTASLLSYLSIDARAAFAAQLDEAARRRPVAWVFAEGAPLVASTGMEIAALSGPLSRNTAQYVVGASLRGGRRHDQLLALADPYLRWLAPARGVDDDFQWVGDRPPQ